ncbi:MAG: hypothetical protein ACRD1X_04200 [Vicinamibacteria bacterium]
MATKLAALKLASPYTATEWLDEPDLLFAGAAKHFDPKVGIPLYGPRSFGEPRHKQEVHVGFIGTSEAVEHARTFYEMCAAGIAGAGEDAPFPGCKEDRGYRSELRLDDRIVELITRQESNELLGIRRSRERFEAILSLLHTKMRLLTQRDHPLDYVSVVLPEDLYRKCRVANYKEPWVGLVHRDLRRAFKALAMQFHPPTQLLLETTTGLAPSTRRKLDHPSRIAWNLFTALYFKVDGLPWSPVGLAPGSCFIGISFFRPLGETSTLRTSVVQAFDEDGEGLVLRGHKFNWDDSQGKSPHLSEEMAGTLIDMVLERYKQERKQLPQRVIVQKTSRFEPAERSGFEQALKRVSQYDLLSLCPENSIRLVRAGRYPPLRGAAFRIGDAWYLYTSGYLASLGGYPHGHVPSPLQITDHVGDTAPTQLLREILVLTKMNLNSANMSGLMPITLRFSRLVGDILREVPESQTPQPKYKYYM